MTLPIQIQDCRIINVVSYVCMYLSKIPDSPGHVDDKIRHHEIINLLFPKHFQNNNLNTFTVSIIEDNENLKLFFAYALPIFRVVLQPTLSRNIL